MTKISVCMATYNGGKFVRGQAVSILSQLSPNDELIVSDDSSSDNTIQELLSLNDERIHIFSNNCFHTPIFNFENAIIHANGDIIFLVDQDDEWRADRIGYALTMHKDGCMLVSCNRLNIYDDRTEISNVNPYSHSWWMNLLKPTYVGCCMSFRRELLNVILPFPKSIAMHDLWIGLLAQRNFKCGFIDTPLINYNRHGESYIAKHKRSFYNRLVYRVNMLLQVFKRENEIGL